MYIAKCNDRWLNLYYVSIYIVKIVLRNLLSMANGHTVWNAPGWFAHTVFYFWNVLNAWTLLSNHGSSSKMRLFQHRFQSNNKSTIMKKQRSTNYSMRAIERHNFCYKSPKNHWETINETGVSERFKHSETLVSSRFSKPRKAIETAPFWSHWSFTRRYQWGRKRLKRRCFHWETPMETLESSVLKCSRAWTLFLQRAFQAFQAFQFEMQLTQRFRPCF